MLLPVGEIDDLVAVLGLNNLGWAWYLTMSGGCRNGNQWPCGSGRTLNTIYVDPFTSGPSRCRRGMCLANQFFVLHRAPVCSAARLVLCRFDGHPDYLHNILHSAIHFNCAWRQSWQLRVIQCMPHSNLTRKTRLTIFQRKRQKAWSMHPKLTNSLLLPCRYTLHTHIKVPLI